MRQQTPETVQDPADLGTELGLEIHLAAQAQTQPVRTPAATAPDPWPRLPLASSAPSED
ncbi:hypothetical protein [Caldimonas brevitalea]|nr:hypothetical protein [Caldimonas brevitalea]